MSEQKNCIFCGDPEMIIENKLAFAHYDSYPVNPGHCLIIPRRHVAEYFQATAEEKAEMARLGMYKTEVASTLPRKQGVA